MQEANSCLGPLKFNWGKVHRTNARLAAPNEGIVFLDGNGISGRRWLGVGVILSDLQPCGLMYAIVLIRKRQKRSDPWYSGVSYNAVKFSVEALETTAWLSIKPAYALIYIPIHFSVDCAFQVTASW